VSGASGVAATLVRVAGWEVLFSIVLFGIVLALALMLRKSSPILRHALWGLVLLRLVLPVDLASPFSLGSLVGRGALVPAMETPLLVEWPTAVGLELGAPSATEAVSADVEGRAGPVPWAVIVVALWLAGVLALGARVWLRRRSYRNIAKRAKPVREARALSVLARWKDELGIRRPVSLVTSPERREPFTLGNLRPTIFVPSAVLHHVERDVMESVIAHELAHIKRWDDLLLRVQLLISVLYFFNPVAWFSANRMRDESERACDELVLSSGRLSPKTYGRSILSVLRMGLESGPSLAPTLGSTKKRLKKRLESIMYKRPSKNRTRTVYPLLTALALGLFLLPMAGSGQEGASAGWQQAGWQEAGWQEAAWPAFRQWTITSSAVWTEVRQDGDVWQITLVLANPLPGGEITARYGMMINPFTEKEAHHNGIDVKGPAGSEIVAPAAGTVAVATTEYEGGAGYGNVVVVDHGDGLKTLYAHLGDLKVEEGQSVAKGDVLAIQGSTGKSTGPHLHFEVSLDGDHLNPSLFVADWRNPR
jgi:beta-lactamase regulating signal transducer with metallopeptidase domain